MGLLALIVVLAIEQFQPLARDGGVVNRLVNDSIERAGRFVDGFEGGRESWLAVLVWAAIVGGVAFGFGALDGMLAALAGVLSFALHVAVLYHTVGLRQFIQPLGEFNQAMQRGEVEQARQLLRDWVSGDEQAESAQQAAAADAKLDSASESELCRIAISHALLATHRNLFGPLFWYLLLPGPIGPVMYRLADRLANRWGSSAEPVPGQPGGANLLSRLARGAFTLIDWLPLRLSAAGFAVVGNFEDAMYCWRAAQSAPPEQHQRALILGAGGGALGVELLEPQMAAVNKPEYSASPADEAGGGTNRFDWTGARADANALKSAVAMVWRVLILWAAVFTLVTIASRVG